MRDAVEALAKRKFGEGGAYNPNTPGAWTDSPKVRGSAVPYTEEFKECNTFTTRMANSQRQFEAFFVLCMFRLSI